MFGPSSQTILSASRPFSAAQVFAAITATPPSGLNFAGAGVPSIFTTFSTPGTFIASAASYDATLPPTTGGRATTAYFMPSSRMSWPYIACPVVMSIRSTTGTLPLPM